MHFSLPPRPHNHQHPHQARNMRLNARWGLGSGYHAVDKARLDASCHIELQNEANYKCRWVHANYRFIVDPRGDYHKHAVDADVHLDWNNVLQILASARSQATSCPICLSKPVAPRMAKCGHIFCLPCLIRYMHSTDDTNPTLEKRARWKKCPICFDTVYISETRPVRWFDGQEGDTPHEHGDVVLRLMMRQAGSTLALPRDGADLLSTTEDIPWYHAAEVADYARVMKGSEGYMLSHYDREIQELLLQEKEDELMFGEETQWTRKAVAAIVEAKEKAKGMGNPPVPPKKPEDRKSRRPPLQFHEPDENVPDFYFIQHASKAGHSRNETFPPRYDSQSSTISDNGSASPSNLATETPAEMQRSNNSLDMPVSSRATNRVVDRLKNLHIEQTHLNESYFFYQALLHYYLSPLDIRILKAAFGDFSSFPATILPRVERVSTGHIVDDDLRKRAKYLAHLPYGCEVGFLECDWTDVVGPDILEHFTPDIERRRKRNREKEAREEKERVRAEKEEDDKRWAATRRRRPSTSKDQYILSEPASHTEDLEDPATLASVDLNAPSSSPPWLSSQARQGSAFASLASPSTSPVAARTVWGTTAVVLASPPLPATGPEPDVTENDGWLQGWENDLLYNDDVVSQSTDNPSGEGTSKAGSVGGSGKRRKNKKITLMTTNARRGA